jgi:predicted kinase
LQVCLETQMRCVVDNTNPTRAERASYITPARAAGFEIVGYFFQSIAADALVRNRQRPVERQVPDKGIRGTRNRLEIPAPSEGFDKLYYVRVAGNQEFTLTEWQDEV